MNRKLAIILILIGIIGLVFYTIYFLNNTKKPTLSSDGGGLFPQTTSTDGFIEISDILNTTEESSETISSTEITSSDDSETFALTDYRVSSGYIDKKQISTLETNLNQVPTKNNIPNTTIQSESFKENIIPIVGVIAFKDSAYNVYDLTTKKMQTYSTDKAYGSYYATFITSKKFFIQLWNESTVKINSFIGEFSYNNREVAECPNSSELLKPKYTAREIESAQTILFKIYPENEDTYTPGALDEITKKAIEALQISQKIKISKTFDTQTKKTLVAKCQEQSQAILDTKLNEENTAALGKTTFKKIQDNISDFTLSGDILYSVTTFGKNSTINSFNTKTFTSKTISELPLREWNIAGIIDENSLLVYQNPSHFIDNYLFVLNTKTNSFTPIVGPEKGLSATCNTRFCLISYVNSTDNTIINELFNIITNDRNKLPFSTLSEKCNFENNLLLCGVPKIISDENPDSWYKGIEHFSDILTEYNIDTKELKLTDTGFKLDIHSITKKIINEIDYYGYIDQKEGYYYITKLKKPEQIPDLTAPQN